MDWLNEAWRFVESEENQKALAFVGAGIAAVVIAGWQVYTHFARSRSSEEASRTVTASGGGLASEETITITQSLPGTLNVGGVHGVPPEDFQRTSGATPPMIPRWRPSGRGLSKSWAPPAISIGPSNY